MSMCNQHAYKSNPEVGEAELLLLKQIRITDTL